MASALKYSLQKTKKVLYIKVDEKVFLLLPYRLA